MLTLTQLESIIIACLPALTSIMGIVIACSKIIKSLGTLKDNESVKKERDELKEYNKQLISQGNQLRKELSLLIEKATRINYNDMSEVRNDKDLQI